MSEFNIHPVHNSFRNLGSNSTHTNTYSPYDESIKAFQDFDSIGSSSTHSTTRQSGFQYVQQLVSLQTVSASGENVPIYEDVVTTYILLVEETLDTFDAIGSGRPRPEEPVPVLEECTIVVIKTFEEVLNTTDLIAKASSFESVNNLLDDNIVIITVLCTEVLAPREDSDAYLRTDVTDTVKIMCQTVTNVTDTVRIGTSGHIDVTDTVNIGVYPEAFTGVVSASGFHSVVPINPIVIDPNDPSPTPLPVPGEVTPVDIDNPFEPTIIIGGEVFATNPSTAPPTYGPQTYWVQWLDLVMPGGNTSSNLQDFSFSLGFEGGQFSFLSKYEMGAKGSEIDIFGLKGTITRTGEKMSNNAYGYLTKGIFGSAKLNKEFNIINYGNQHYIQYVGSQVLYPLNVQPNQQMTVSDMVRNILISSGEHGGFYVVDAPYTDVLGQSGQTGIEALGSLASQVGAQVRWSGNDIYNIVYPNFSAGTYTIPHHRLITAEGTEYETILDLGLGVTGTGVLQIPKANLFETDTNDTPLGDTVPTLIDVIYPITSAISAGSPPLKVPLPADAASAKIQILVNDTNGTGSATGPGAGWITQNESIWFDLGTPAISNPYVKLSDSNISYKPYVQITSAMFPNIDAINNGDFVMNIGVERQDFSGDFADAQDDEAKRLKDLINRMLANLRFIKTYEGTINCYFFGSIPLPGMWASATNICGKTVEGIIESVSFNHPGILTIQVAQYLRVNFLDAKDNYTSNPLNVVI